MSQKDVQQLLSQTPTYKRTSIITIAPADPSQAIYGEARDIGAAADRVAVAISSSEDTSLTGGSCAHSLRLRQGKRSFLSLLFFVVQLLFVFTLLVVISFSVISSLMFYILFTINVTDGVPVR